MAFRKCEEFLAIKESLEDYEDLKELRKARAKEAESPTASLARVRNELLNE